MTKNTGMNAKDEKAGKTAALPAAKAGKINKLLKEESMKTPPTKTTSMVEDARQKKKTK